MGLDRGLLGFALLTAACASAPARRASDIPALPLSEIDASWPRIWYVTAKQPDEFAG